MREKEWETSWLQLNFPAIVHDNFLQVIALLSPLHFRSLALEVMVYGQEKTRAMSFMMALIICARPLLLLLLLLFAFGRIASEKVMINLGHAIAAAAASEVKAANR